MNPEMVFDKERIYEKISGYDTEGDSRVVTELIRRIRNKIKRYTKHEYIETVWGMGYKWKNKNLSLRKTIVLYMIVSLIVSFYLSALIMRMAATIQDDIWWKYVDQEKYFEMAEGDGRKYLTDVPRPNSYEMKNLIIMYQRYVTSFRRLQYLLCLW